VHAINQKVAILLIFISFPLFISCSDMLSEYITKHHGPSLLGDVQITNNSFSQCPSLVWTGTEYSAAWKDDRTGSQIYFARISSAGIKQDQDVRITNTIQSLRPSLVWTGNEYGLAWESVQDGKYEIYFARLYPDGTKK
jgi:hypothetical protein